MKQYFSRKVVTPLLNLLKQGITPSQLAWAVTAGIMITTVPVFFTGTILCFAVIWLFRLNPVAVLVVNQIAYPLQFFCFLPLVHAGEWMFNTETSALTLSGIASQFESNFTLAFRSLWKATLYGLAAWSLAVVPVTLVIYTVFYRVFKRVSRNTAAEDVKHD